MAYPIGDDVRKYDELSSGLDKFAGTASTLLLVLAVWVRTTHLQVDPGKIVGFVGVTGLNVGHAIVFGPIAAFVILAVNYGRLGKIAMLGAAIRQRLKHTPSLRDDLSDSSLLTLGLFGEPRSFALSGLVARIAKAFWYFIVPALCGLVLFRRFLDFIPRTETGHKWEFADRLVLHFFSLRAWEIPPIIADEGMEKPEVADFLPFIYSPLQAWVYLVLAIASLYIAWRSIGMFWKLE